VIERIRADGRHRHLPAIALTAEESEEEDTVRAQEAGYQCHVTKPASLDALVQAISELAGTH